MTDQNQVTVSGQTIDTTGYFLTYVKSDEPLYACGKCAALVVPPDIPLHRLWHEQIAR